MLRGLSRYVEMAGTGRNLDDWDEWIWGRVHRLGVRHAMGKWIV